MNLKKATEPNSIPTKLLKVFDKTISVPLANLINLYFEKGIFPKSLKIASVIPIFKKGDYLDCNNYRPISLTSNISKLLKKLIRTRLYSFLESNKVICNCQFGFRNNHSTTHALIDITEKIRSALDKGTFACGVYIDLQKAFDTVNHSILMGKLEYYGIRGVPKMWLESFLIGRHQFTHIKDKSSCKLPITHGVPQGSVLGPLLFLLYINDLHKAVQHSSVHHFADDTNLLYTSKSLKKMNKHINHDIKHLCQWLRSNKISLNASKTEIIIFKTKLKTITKHLNFRVSGQKINPTTSVKYLGVHLNNSLTWEIHFKNLQTKLNRAIGLLSKIRHYTPKSFLKTIYFSLFNSHLIYACQIWGQSKTKLFQEIEKLQEKAIRIISFLPKGASVKDAYSTLKILKIRDFISL